MSKDNPLALIMATMVEAAPFVDRLDLTLETDKPCPVYRNEGLLLIISGIGKTNAAIAATYAILSCKASRLCNIGAAGAVKPGFVLGDICHIDTVIEYDRPHLRTEKTRTMTPEVLPGFRCVTVATQDKPVIDPAQRKAIAVCTDLVDMEAAGVLQAARKFSVPCASFKFVSDTAEDDRNVDIVAHIKEYRQAFCDFIVRDVLPVLNT